MMKQKTLVRASVALVLAIALFTAPAALAAPARDADRPSEAGAWLDDLVTRAYNLLVTTLLEVEKSPPVQDERRGVSTLTAAEEAGPSIDPN